MNIRECVGWAVGCRVVDVTSNDPIDVGDGLFVEDESFIVIHFDNGGTINVPITAEGFSYNNPGRHDGEGGAMAEFRQASTITKRASGLKVEQTSGVADEWALKVVSEAATQETTIIRLKGPSAQADIQTVYQLFARQFDVLGLEP